jgi:hypothetical protein
MRRALTERFISAKACRINGGGRSGRRPSLSEDLIGYDQLMQDAMRHVVRAALQRATNARGLPGKHHFYITFRTHGAGVILPEHLTTRYPEEMTIVLEHQFWDLDVQNDRFRVILKFAGQPHPIVVPYAALTRFYDPSVRFGLQFDQNEAIVEGANAEPAPEEIAEPRQAEAGAVVSLDAFRKN